MIDLKIKKFIKTMPLPEAHKSNAYKTMLKKYKALSIAQKEAFENQLDQQLVTAESITPEVARAELERRTNQKG